MTRLTVWSFTESPWVRSIFYLYILIPRYIYIAVLHPRHKLTYFKNAGWPDNWIDAAERIVRDEFERSYARSDDVEDEEGDGDEEAVNSVCDYAVRMCANTKLVFQETTANIFDSIPALARPRRSTLLDELTKYLNADPEYVEDVLSWWYVNRSTYPRLSRMALDYLTIPGMCQLTLPYRSVTDLCIPATSVDVERIFSRGRLLLSHVRNRLSAQTTRAILCLGSWSSLGLVKDEDVMKVAVMKDVEGDVEEEFEDGWDSIKN